ncbi:sodium- and chloride-dependent GABA transporter ine-like, partial [Scleropages formosus]
SDLKIKSNPSKPNKPNQIQKGCGGLVGSAGACRVADVGFEPSLRSLATDWCPVLGVSFALAPHASVNMEAETKRPTWNKQIEFTLAAIGCAVGLGNVWRFPYLCYRSGGGAFLVPYLLMLVLLGIPLLYVELSSPLPWENCNNTWNRPNCTSSTTNSSFSSTASQQFFKLVPLIRVQLRELRLACDVDHHSLFSYKVLERTAGVGDPGTIRWELILLLLVAWILVYLSIFKGVKSTGKVVYFTALFPYVILVALLINNVQLPGAMKGIEFYIIPEWDKLKSLEVWVNAAAQIFNSLGIGFGSLMAMASYNDFHNSILKDTLVVSITNSFTSILAGFVIFSAIGYMSHLQSIAVSDIAVDGPGLVFVVYPQAFPTMSVAPLWAVLFFFMLLCLGLDSQFAMVEVMVTSLVDAYSASLLKYLKNKEILILIVCCSAFLLGIPHVMQVGIYVFQLMDHYTAIISIMFLAFFEVLAICWLYGVKRLSENVEEMTGKKPGTFFTVCWAVICPVLVAVLLVFSVIQFKPARYETYQYPAWCQGIGWVIAMASVIWIPLCALHTLWVLPGTFTQVPSLSSHSLQDALLKNRLKRLWKSITPCGLDEKSAFLESQGEVNDLA